MALGTSMLLIGMRPETLIPPQFDIELPWPVFHALRLLGLFTFVASCGISILRHDLVVLNPLLRQLVVTIVLTVVLTGGYLAVRAALGSDPVAATLTAVGLALASPVLYRWLRGGVNWFVYGQQGSPADMAAALTRRMATKADPAEVMAVMADVVKAVVPNSAVEVTLTAAGGRKLLGVSRGNPAGSEVITTIPLSFQGSDLGCVEILGHRILDAYERGLLTALVASGSAAVAAAHRSSELQLARQDLIAAREQERRRIARDLHDGVGPVLSGLGFTIDSLRGTIHEPAAAEVAARARGQVRDAVQLVRRVARELRPPGVDQLGLLGALRELAAQHSNHSMTVTITAGDLGELGAATEVAAHAIVAEALTNSARHAKASHCSITLDRVDDSVEVVVQDDGGGIADALPGVGCTSMIERADELGGWCKITSHPAVGTTVAAHLPLNTLGIRLSEPRSVRSTGQVVS